MKGLSKFVVDLAHIWAERGFRGGVKLGPFDQFRKDPCREVYKAIFSTIEKLAASKAASRADRTLPVPRRLRIIVPHAEVKAWPAWC